MNYSKRCVLVVSGTPPPYSGPEVMTEQLLNSSLRERYKLLHYNISKGRDASTKANFDIINVMYGVFQPVKLFFLILRSKPDIIYTNLAQNLAGFLRYMTFIMTAALCGVPAVVSVIGDGFNHFYARSNYILKALICWTLSKIDGFIVLADTLKTQFAGLVPTEKLYTVYSGIDPFTFNCLRTREEDDVLHVLFVGYLTQAKGVYDLLKAVPEVVATHNKVHFDLMGSMIDIERNIFYIKNPPSNEATLNQLLQHAIIAQHVTLLGVQSGTEKIHSFCNADLFVLPSYSEAFPTVVLEAMAAGLPIIATPVGALPEVFDERSLIFIQPGDVLGLAQAILRLLGDDEMRQRMGDFNKTLVQTRFNLNAYADGIDKVLIQCLYNDKPDLTK